MTRGVFLERALDSDVPALAALEVACFSHPWTPAQIRDEVAAGPPGAVLVLRGVAPQGGGDLCGACAYRVVLDEMLILDLAVHPACRGRGFARFLLRVALRRAAAAGARRALLEVRAGNLGARRLYESLGFARDGVRRDYYSEPVEDAILLLRDGLERIC